MTNPICLWRGHAYFRIAEIGGCRFYLCQRCAKQVGVDGHTGRCATTRAGVRKMKKDARTMRDALRRAAFSGLRNYGRSKT